MFKTAILLACVVVVARAQYALPAIAGLPAAYDGGGIPNPYSYSYDSPAIGGSSSHQESGDGTGRVQGSYSVTDEDGRTRTVEYVADELGFRANVNTNEPGTASSNPADVTINSSADDGTGAYAAAPAAYGAAPYPIAAGLPYGY